MGRKKTGGVETAYVRLRKLLMTAIAEKNYRWVDVVERMELPMTTNTLTVKVRDPSKMKVNELFDIAHAIGITPSEVLEALR